MATAAAARQAAAAAAARAAAAAAAAAASTIPSDTPSDREWRRRDRWHVYVRCNVNKQENCENCPDTIGGHAYGPTYSIANARAQSDANRNLSLQGAKNCQAKHCHAVACFENGRQVRCPEYN
jgi:hypothetical protein